MTDTQLRAEFALAKALLCVRVTAHNEDSDIEMGIASYPFPKEVTRRYCAVFEAMDIAAPVTFDRTGDALYEAPPALTPDQACFTGTFRADFNKQFERRRAFVRASWIRPEARAFAERASETLYAVSAMIGEAAMALATDAVVAEDLRAQEALAAVKGDHEAALPDYRTILAQHFGADAWRAAGEEVAVAAVLRDLIEGNTEAACLGALAAARVVAAAARALERRRGQDC